MRKAAVALPTAALLSVTALSTVPAAAPAAASGTVATSASYSRPVSLRTIKRYHLKHRELKQIFKAKRWAKTRKARAVRRCESGGNYRINTGNGYYGAWQFAYGTWLGIGGGRYARTANRAPKFAQDHMAWRLWRQQGWSPWSCA